MHIRKNNRITIIHVRGEGEGEGEYHLVVNCYICVICLGPCDHSILASYMSDPHISISSLNCCHPQAVEEMHPSKNEQQITTNTLDTKRLSGKT